MRRALVVVATLVVFLSLPALSCDDHAPGTAPATHTMSRTTGWIAGQVREVDLDDGTLALGHGRIAAWGMKPMESMVFKAPDASAITRLKVGDKVTFRAGMVGRQPAIKEIRLATK